MGDPQQDFHFKSSQYERPHCKWVCGRASEGAPCDVGPTRKGRCGIVTSCEPILNEDRYSCALPPLHGGPCKEGPLPNGQCCQTDTRCQPNRSLITRRRLIAIWASAVTFGFCLWIFGTEKPTEAISPGKLTFQHRSINNGCASCHTAAEGGLSHWIHGAFDSKTAMADSQKCLECHRELGEDALSAHGLGHTQLAKLSSKATLGDKRHQPFSLQVTHLSGLSSITASRKKLACATCHHEHRGEQFDLKAMSNTHCNNCHQKQFKDFSHGHPEFADFPYKRRTRIYFDHTRHMKSYFPEATANASSPNHGQKFDCKTCHEPDRKGNRILTRSFEATCKNCHERQIIDRDFPGVAFLQLPDINFEKLKKAKIPVGQWPQIGSQKRISVLPPFLKMLLKSDADYRAAMKELKDVDLRELSNPPDKLLKPMAQLAWSIKRLLHDVALNGDKELEKRLGPDAKYLLPFKPSIVASFVSAQQQWFPDLAAEMKKHHANMLDETSNVIVPATAINPEIATIQKGGGWYRRDDDLSIRYRPTGHADSFLKKWIEVTTRNWPAEKAENSLAKLSKTLMNPTASGGPGTNGPVASGRCILCHTVDRLPDRSFRVNWSISSPKTDDRPLTKFSHAPHIRPLGTQICTSCHQFENPPKRKEAGPFRSEFFIQKPKTNAWTLQTNCMKSRTSGFSAVTQVSCAQCHTPKAAGANCLQCHQYHSHGRDK
jgi:hypothetical protein